ncbi:MAG: recombination protein RecR [Deltaproteobacteria bacterium]|nr:recombination protein RecR [Deltaproteobacteria bacterium]MBW2254056.1 recombination protein RecR [Deltaproteobacteria bacterium]
MSTTNPIRRAVQQLSRMPGVGEKTATRLVYWLLRAPEGTGREIADALIALENGVKECSVCCDLTPRDPCRICADPNRDPGAVCVVEQPQDVLAFERSGEFRGGYHVLHGAISPLDGVGPDDLRIRALLERLRGETVTEVILATDPDVEGDATALYIARLLKPIQVRVTRLAHGLSVGTEIEYVDALTLARALQNRREL